MTTAADILKSKPNQAIFAIGPRASVYDALQLAADKGVGALLVMEDERVVGIVTERDYARKVALISRSSKDTAVSDAVNVTLGGAIFQILLLDLVFSVDSIITAVGMTDHLAIMYIAVIVAITVMLLAATPLANFIEKNPTIVMLALGFLLMIGMTLIADGFGFHVPKGYIYAAMGFSALVEGLNMLARRGKQRGGDH